MNHQNLEISYLPGSTQVVVRDGENEYSFLSYEDACRFVQAVNGAVSPSLLNRPSKGLFGQLTDYLLSWF